MFRELTALHGTFGELPAAPREAPGPVLDALLAEGQEPPQRRVALRALAPSPGRTRALRRVALLNRNAKPADRVTVAGKRPAPDHGPLRPDDQAGAGRVLLAGAEAGPSRGSASVARE